MNKKIRAIICLCSFTMVAIYTIELLLGKLNFIGKMTLYICYGMYVFVIIYNLLIVLQKTSENKKWYNKSYNIFEIGFNHLKDIHQKRYKLYFSGDKKKIEIYSTKIAVLGKELLQLGEILSSKKRLNKKKRIKLEEMMKETERLMTEIKA